MVFLEIDLVDAVRVGIGDHRTTAETQTTDSRRAWTSERRYHHGHIAVIRTRGVGIGFGLFQNAAGLFIIPMQQDFHWSRAALNAIKYLANTMRMSIVAAGTHESLHAMRYDPQIASRCEQLELPLWGETEEFRRFVAGVIRTLPVRHTAGELDRRAIAYMLELTDGVTGRVVELLRRAAKYTLSIRSKRIGLEVLQHVGARLPSIISQPT